MRVLDWRASVAFVLALSQVSSFPATPLRSLLVPLSCVRKLINENDLAELRSFQRSEKKSISQWRTHSHTYTHTHLYSFAASGPNNRVIMRQLATQGIQQLALTPTTDTIPFSYSSFTV